MVLDPFTVIGLAGNIVQFVDYSSKLISSTHEIYRSSTGSSQDHDHLEGIATRLLEFSRALEQPKPFGTESYEKTIHELRKECILDAESLLNLIKALRARKDSKWSSFRQAVSSATKKNEINRLERRLKDHQSGLATQVIAMLSDQSSIIIHTLKLMVDENRKMDIQRTDQLLELKAKIDQIGRSKFATGLSDFDNLQETLSSLACTGHELLAEQTVLKSLRFREIRIRFEQIPRAYTATLRWVLQPSRPRHPIKFLNWLENPSQKQPYWISGKPGSGKSTLMKFIYEHPIMKASLRKWAGSDTLITASFFFWFYGTEMQKSQEGLLQTLLHEILRKCPNLIQTCLPHRYASGFQYPWTRSELLEAFSTLKHGLTTSTKFCIFIDGLDEFHGEPRDLLPVIRDLSDSPNVKVCVSSRPWQIFIDEFDRSPHFRLYLQNLTKDDIQAYVRHNFEKDNNFQQARKEDPGYEHLVNEIVDRAQGVWLWVALVTKSLLNGFTYGDSLKDLERRLQHLPVDLEEFFQHILDSVEPVYQTQMAQTFLLALAAKNDLPLLVYSFLDDIREDADFAMNLNDFSAYSATRNAAQREIRMRKRLDARSKGLLEVSNGNKNSVDGWLDDRVEFLHRTVGEFLNKKEIKTRFVQTSGPNFDPNTSLCHGFLAVCKSIPPPRVGIIGGALEVSIHDLLGYAYMSEIKRAVAQMEIIDELERYLVFKHCFTTGIKFAQNGQRLNPKRPVLMNSELHSVFELCVQHGLCIYVEQRLQRDPSIISSRQWHRPLLSNALLPVEMTLKHHNIDPTTMIRLLLDHGADPNAVDGESTTWCKFIRDMVDHPSNLKRQLMELLLTNGADSSSASGILLENPNLLDSHAKANYIWMFDKLLETGIDPNSKYHDSTVWQQYLTMLVQRENRQGEFREPTKFKQVKLLLLAGADPNAIACGRRVDEIIQQVLRGFFLTELLELLNEMRLRKEGGVLTRIWKAAWGTSRPTTCETGQ